MAVGIGRQAVGLILTSGKVPLEKTLNKSVMIQDVIDGVDEFQARPSGDCFKIVGYNRASPKGEMTRYEAEKAEQTHINKQVLPQAPSPTMTSFRRISAMISEGSGEGN